MTAIKESKAKRLDHSISKIVTGSSEKNGRRNQHDNLNKNEADLIHIRDFLKPLTPGESLKAYRLREDYTQLQLAEIVGITQKNISQMENNKRTIDKQAALKFAEILHCDVHAFL